MENFRYFENFESSFKRHCGEGRENSSFDLSIDMDNLKIESKDFSLDRQCDDS